MNKKIKSWLFRWKNQSKSTVIAGLLALFLGLLGLHQLYLGHYKKFIQYLLLTGVGWIFFGLGPLVAFVLSMFEGMQLLNTEDLVIRSKDSA